MMNRREKHAEYRKIWMILSILIILSFVCLIRPVYACLLAQDQKINVFSIAQDQVDLEDIYEEEERKPGETFEKTVTVANNGTRNARPSVRILFSDSRMKNYCSLNLDQEKWNYSAQKDIYIYSQDLAPGEKTEPLFTKVSLHKDIPDELCKNFEIIILMESTSREEK